jgi:hypothetical protein
VKVKVTKLGFCDGLLPSLEELRALKRLKEIVCLLLDRRERTFSLDNPEELRALKRLKEIVCLLLDRGEWTMPLEKPPAGDERRTSFWNVAQDEKARPEDRQYWAELRSLWSQLQNVKSSLPPFRALPGVGRAIVRGELTGQDYDSLLRSWQPEFDDPARDRQYWAELRSLWSQLQNVRSPLPPFHSLPRLGQAIVRGELTHQDYASIVHSWRPKYDEPETLHSCIQEALEKSQTDPVELDFAGFWIFKNNRYSIDGQNGIEENKLLVLEEFDRERRHFERLHQKHRSAVSDTSQLGRPRLPEAVRIEVWRRDGGRCSRCESRENLEYDHIVPLAKGGSNTARNIELLCEKCNRSKADKIE